MLVIAEPIVQGASYFTLHVYQDLLSYIHSELDLRISALAKSVMMDRTSDYFKG